MPFSFARSQAERLPAFRLTPAAAALAAIFSATALLGAFPAAAADTALPEVTVKGTGERAEGPVQGYRATRSATFTKTDTPLREVPASLTVVPEELMEDQAMKSISDVLRYVPGTMGLQGEGNRDQVSLRGINTTADFFIDGVRDDAQIFRDLYNLERVEVLKGPAGMIFGRGGAGGVINRVAKKPVFGRVGKASAQAGQYEQLRGTVDIGNKLGESAAWRLNLMGEAAESFRDGFNMRRHGINPALTLLPNERTVLTLGADYLFDSRTADRGIPSQGGRPYATDPSTFFGNAEQSVSRADVRGLYAILEHDFGGAQLKNTLRATRYDKFYQNVFAGGAVNGAGNVNISAYNNANLRTNIFNQTDVTTKFRTGGIAHTLLAGVEVGRQESESLRNTGFFGAATSAAVAAGAPRATATRFAASGSDANNEVYANVAAAYLQDQVALSEQWKILAGLRYDYFRVRLDDRRTTVAPVDLARTDKELSPRAGLIWTPTPGSAYYASYSYSFLPSAEQLSLAANTTDLAPEKAINLEIGGRWDLRPGLTLSAAVFRLDRDDVRSPDPANPGFFVQTGRQRTEGVELGLQGDITSRWQVFAGYAYLDGRIVETTSSAPAGRKLGLVPKHTVSAWNKVDLGHGFSVGLGLIRQDESFTSFSNAVTIPAFTRLDGAVYYDFPDGKTRLALNVENLLDKEYFPTAHNDNNISPGAPRSALLTLSSSF